MDVDEQFFQAPYDDWLWPWTMTRNNLVLPRLLLSGDANTETEAQLRGRGSPSSCFVFIKWDRTIYHRGIKAVQTLLQDCYCYTGRFAVCTFILPIFGRLFLEDCGTYRRGILSGGSGPLGVGLEVFLVYPYSLLTFCFLTAGVTWPTPSCSSHMPSRPW